MSSYLSLIIPCYNSNATIKKQLPGLISFLKENKISYEIIIIDDGSKDGKALEKIALSEQCKYFRNKTNLGKGASIKNGMAIATGQFKLFTDADIPFEYETIITILKYLDKKEFHVVIGDRSLESSAYFNNITFSRKISSNLFSFFVGRFVTTGMNDTQCGIKGFRKEIADDIFNVSRIKGFAFDVELLYISLKRNYDIKRIPVSLRSQDTTTTVSLLKHTIPMVFDLFLIKWNHIKGLYNKKRAI